MTKAEKINLVTSLLDEAGTIHATSTIPEKLAVLDTAKNLIKSFAMPKTPTLDEVNINNAKVMLNVVVATYPDKVAFFVCQSLELALTELLKDK
jgi:hypothetical protein